MVRAALPALLCALAALVAPLTSAAFERSDGAIVQCEVTRDGETRVVRETWLGHGDLGDRHPALGGAAAVVRPGEDGWPVIFFDAVVFRAMLARDPHMADFIFYHECAHAQDPQRDEIEANCEAYLELDKLGALTPERVDALAATHKKMLRLPSRYGGSGEVFWEKTLSCVKSRAQTSLR